ncbi:hypothetical protein NEOLI_000601 [Neolecta irregularis DAH-3]|uniref:Uncharacterized protein n=1 Tax=Neolecta irregularis (strain DAH-3) TaxID=1198029 RepID=A0A1U7LR62_NEOID|nr:hypothetical protein NEOLI_000601 [Neolecta irregularis DAH-3]|eukprot:OLL25147.1 hypothetical protein NEOLI_000601 [Neolecta irregularis DAH-3]
MPLTLPFHIDLANLDPPPLVQSTLTPILTPPELSHAAIHSQSLIGSAKHECRSQLVKVSAASEDRIYSPSHSRVPSSTTPTYVSFPRLDPDPATDH